MNLCRVAFLKRKSTRKGYIGLKRGRVVAGEEIVIVPMVIRMGIRMGMGVGEVVGKEMGMEIGMEVRIRI